MKRWHSIPSSIIALVVVSIATGFFFYTVGDRGKTKTIAERSMETTTSVVDQIYDIFIIVVDYKRSTDEGVKAGHYSWVNVNINSENFSPLNKEEDEITIYPIIVNRKATTAQVLAEMDQQDLRPANIQECLAVGEKYPNAKRDHPLVFLGSGWQSPLGDNRWPCLGGDGSYRELSLCWPINGWDKYTQFATVSKSK